MNTVLQITTSLAVSTIINQALTDYVNEKYAAQLLFNKQLRYAVVAGIAVTSFVGGAVAAKIVNVALDK